MFDLNSTVVQEVPEIKGIPPNSLAYQVLNKYFKDHYIGEARKNGWPFLEIAAVMEEEEPSQLDITSYERQVTSSSNPIASTLDSTCMTSNHPLPTSYPFDWNWVSEDQVGQIHSTLAINRIHLSQMFYKQLHKQNISFCCEFLPIWNTKEPRRFLGALSVPGRSPDVTIHPTRDKLFEYRYWSHVEDYQEFVESGPAGCVVSQDYAGSLSVKETSIIHKYSIWFQLIGLKWSSKTFATLSVQVAQPYTPAVDAGGNFYLRKEKPTVTNESEYDTEDLVNFNPYLFLTQLLGYTTIVLRLVLWDEQFSQVQKSIFPGSKVFTFTNVQISEYQDLVCDSSYLSQTESKGKSALGAATGIKLTHSSELMENYIHADVQPPSPSGHFEALRTDRKNGHALVFAVGSNSIFYGWEECSGESKAGWKRHDLSSPTMLMDFLPKVGNNAAVQTFGMGQSPLDSTIGMAMAVDAEEVDNLYISLGNSSSDVSWISRPRWTAVPFDGVSEGKDFRITNVMFTELAFNIQYLMVDINKGEGGHQVVRYHIDLGKPNGKAWVKHDFPIDLDPGVTYKSVVGRKHNERVDGIYTAGGIEGSAQLVYEPLVNIYDDDAPPTVTRLSLPSKELPSAIATTRNTNKSSGLYKSTDLYMMAGTTIYRYRQRCRWGHCPGR